MCTDYAKRDSEKQVKLNTCVYRVIIIREKIIVTVVIMKFIKVILIIMLIIQ
jgi:hypothetical protein